jgi:hypothetical protein
MFPTPVVPNPYDDDAQRAERLNAQVDADARRTALVFVGGLIVLVAFGLLLLVGLPGAGLVLVPIGLGMLVGSGIELLVGRVHA